MPISNRHPAEGHCAECLDQRLDAYFTDESLKGPWSMPRS